ncbi:MAG: heavy metal-associated domain-containing protein [Myxococcota bacterium]
MASDDSRTDVLTIEVRGLHCPGCVARLERVLELQAGVVHAKVDFLRGTARVALAPETDRAATTSRLLEVIEASGFYPVTPP